MATIAMLSKADAARFNCIACSAACVVGDALAGIDSWLGRAVDRRRSHRVVMSR